MKTRFVIKEGAVSPLWIYEVKKTIKSIEAEGCEWFNSFEEAYKKTLENIKCQEEQFKRNRHMLKKLSRVYKESRKK